GNYDIKGTHISPLLGPKVYMKVTEGVTYANVGVNIVSPATTVQAGAKVTYTVEVTNAGRNPVTGASVKDTLPPQVRDASWTCVGANGASCMGTGTGSLDDTTLVIPVGGKVTYTVTATVSSSAATGQLAYVVNVNVPPVNASDPDPSNNSAGNYKQITVA